MPERFDKYGRKKSTESRNDSSVDPIAVKVEEFLAGKGTAGKLFTTLKDSLLGGGKEERSSGRRRRDYD